MYGCESWTIKKLSIEELMLLSCGVGEDFWESLGLQGDPTSQSQRKSVLNIHGKDWCWSWNSDTLATWSEKLTHWKRPWCWERLKAGGGGDDRGWGGWMASLTWWTWVWASSGSWRWTGKPGMLPSMGLQRVGHDWVTELNWTELQKKGKALSWCFARSQSLADMEICGLYVYVNLLMILAKTVTSWATVCLYCHHE